MMDAIFAEARNFTENLQFDDDVCFVGLQVARLGDPAPTMPTLSEGVAKALPV